MTSPEKISLQKFRCWSCQQKLSVPRDQEGQKFTCPTCCVGSQIPVAGSSGSAKNGVSVKFNCTRCNQKLSAPEWSVGRVIDCPVCKRETQVGDKRNGASFGLSSVTDKSARKEGDPEKGKQVCNSGSNGAKKDDAELVCGVVVGAMEGSGPDSDYSSCLKEAPVESEKGPNEQKAPPSLIGSEASNNGSKEELVSGGHEPSGPQSVAPTEELGAEELATISSEYGRIRHVGDEMESIVEDSGEVTEPTPAGLRNGKRRENGAPDSSAAKDLEYLKGPAHDNATRQINEEIVLGDEPTDGTPASVEAVGSGADQTEDGENQSSETGQEETQLNQDSTDLLDALADLGFLVEQVPGSEKQGGAE